MEALLFQVSPTDPAVFAGAALVLVSVALGACLVPARQAIALDPVESIRAE